MQFEEKQATDPRVRVGFLLVMLTVLLGAHAGPASAQGVEPVEVAGTATCPDGMRLITRFDPVFSSSQGGVTITKSVDSMHLDWSSTVDVDVVLVKGGDNANQYTYPAGTRAGTDLQAPLGKHGAGNRISWVEFCTAQSPSIDVTIVKTGVEAQAPAGGKVNFTITVTNAGNTSFATYVFDDPACDEVRTGANHSDTTFDPGDVWTYTCSMTTTAAQTEACNTATVSGTNMGGQGTGPKSSTACIPLVPPMSPPPGGGTTPPPPPGGGVLPEVAVARAALRGPSGCVKQAFRARVRGENITQVTFFVDGKRVKRIAGERTAFSVKIKPSKYGFGRHRVAARVKFAAETGEAPRRLRLTFRRCAREQVSPRFTG